MLRDIASAQAPASWKPTGTVLTEGCLFLGDPQNGIGVPFGFRLKQTQKGVPPTKDTHMGVGGHQVGWDLCPPTTFDRIPSEIWLA